MNSFMQTSWSWVEGLNGMRTGILNALTDDDLAFNPGGDNISFGQLFVSLGEIEYSYITSFETFKQDWLYKNEDDTVATSVAALKTWFDDMDERLKTTISAFSEDDLKRSVERSGGGSMPVDLQLQAYMQAVFIVFGKFVVYLKAMKKNPPSLCRRVHRMI